MEGDDEDGEKEDDLNEDEYREDDFVTFDEKIEHAPNNFGTCTCKMIYLGLGPLSLHAMRL